MDIKLIISIYAAVLSTLVAFWRVYEFFDDRKGKIIVKITPVTQTLVRPSTWQDLGSSYSIDIINRSKNKRHIEKAPNFELNQSNNGKNYITALDFASKLKFPYPLESGEKLNVKYPIDEIKEGVNKAGATAFRVYVLDTHGKTYYSNWIDLMPNSTSVFPESL